jgi:hypothetical protein
VGPTDPDIGQRPVAIAFAIVVDTREWDIYLTGEVQEWLDRLQVDDLPSAELVDDAIYALSRSGPTLGRPLVDTIAHSTITNLKNFDLVRGAGARS